MIDDVFVFDGVAHPFNFESKNAFGKPGEMFANHLYAFHATLTPEDAEHLSAEEFMRKWTIEDIRRMVYEESDTWRMDDPQIAFPIFEKAQELGVNLIGVHKGVPLGPQPIEHTQTWDMDGAAANFPDINFVIYHVGLPFLDETCWQLIRYPNLYASIAATINFLVRAPRMFAEIIGKLLFWCGADKIVYGSEAPIFHRSGRCARSWTSRSRRTCATATATRS
jgi:predicted TIM-barrel fold metal-dependent hydrolase